MEPFKTTEEVWWRRQNRILKSLLKIVVCPIFIIYTKGRKDTSVALLHRCVWTCYYHRWIQQFLPTISTTAEIPRFQQSFWRALDKVPFLFRQKFRLAKTIGITNESWTNLTPIQRGIRRVSNGQLKNEV